MTLILTRRLQKKRLQKKWKLVHTKCMPWRKDIECEFDVLPTTEKERKDFFNEETDWMKIDRGV